VDGWSLAFTGNMSGSGDELSLFPARVGSYHISKS